IHPSFSRPCSNASTRALPWGSFSAGSINTPIRFILFCCARAVRDGSSAGAAAAPPSNVMNSRRPISDIGLPPALHRRPVYRTLNLAQKGGQVLGPKLNRSESRGCGPDRFVRSLVALPPSGDLLPCAKHLFVAAKSVGVRQETAALRGFSSLQRPCSARVAAVALLPALISRARHQPPAPPPSAITIPSPKAAV